MCLLIHKYFASIFSVPLRSAMLTQQIQSLRQEVEYHDAREGRRLLLGAEQRQQIGHHGDDDKKMKSKLHPRDGSSVFTERRRRRGGARRRRRRGSGRLRRRLRLLRVGAALLLRAAALIAAASGLVLLPLESRIDVALVPSAKQFTANSAQQPVSARHRDDLILAAPAAPPALPLSVSDFLFRLSIILSCSAVLLLLK